VSHPPLAPDHIDRPHQEAALGDLALESGESIRDYRQSYVTHGTLAPDRGNAILICSALTGNHHRLDFLIGPGKALDPARWFIVATDAIGNGLSTSPSNSLLQPGMRFPRFGLRDMVLAQYRLLTEHLGMDRLHAVVGASMGGMQALQWGVSHPSFMKKLVAMTPMARTTAWSLMVTRTARECLMADPAWTGDGFSAVPERGWRAYASLMAGMMMRTPAALEAGIADPAGADAWQERAIAHQRLAGFDAHDYLYQSRAYDAHDVGTTPGFNGDTAAALASVRAQALLIAPPFDLFNRAGAARAATKEIPRARFVEIPSMQGHQSATSLEPADARFLNAVVGPFLA
jgi:homoserine O-acetyltransferase/O-succinyltransferase